MKIVIINVIMHFNLEKTRKAIFLKLKIVHLGRVDGDETSTKE